MENLEMLEARMLQDVSDYVRSMDGFETALNERSTKWNDRSKRSRKFAKARSRMINLIISAAIAGAALFLILTMIVMP